MEMNNRNIVIFVDIQQDEPAYLRTDENCDLYLCTLRKQGETFVEQNIKPASYVDARVFVARACRKANEIISEISKNEE